MNNFILYLRRLFAPEPWVSELCSGFATTLWGIMVLISSDSHLPEDFPSARILVQLDGDSLSLWAILAIVFGIGQMFFFRVLDQNWDRPWFRWFAAIVNGWLWAIFTVSVFVTEPHSLGVAAFLGWCVLNVILIARIFAIRRQIA